MKKSDNGRYSPRQDHQSLNDALQPSKLMVLFEDELRDIYWAETELTKAIPKMISNATSPELIYELENLLSQTKVQVRRLEQVFELLGKRASARRCEAMVGLIKEGSEIMDQCDEGAMLDAGIISAAQKIEHYEIASYGTLRQFAKTLRYSNAAELLEQSLVEEKTVDEKLTKIAVGEINGRAEMEIIE